MTSKIVFYRAVHTKTPWRKVNSHKSLHNALHGPKDGAPAFFARRARIDYEKYGDPLYVVIWEENEDIGYVVKQVTSTSNGTAYVKVPIDVIRTYEAQNGASLTELAAHFFTQTDNKDSSFQHLNERKLEPLQAPDTIQSAIEPASMNMEAQQQGWLEDSVSYGAITARRGQAGFRKRLMEAYSGRCCISGCQLEALLEATHIRPHAEEPNYSTNNGLLLRADLHTLYDLHLLGVDEFGNVMLSSDVKDPYYKELISKVQRISPPGRSEDLPSKDDRRARMALFRP